MKDLTLKLEFAALLLVQVLALLSCTSAQPVSAGLRAEAELAVEMEIDSPTRLTFGDAWSLGGRSQGRLLCGEVSGLRQMGDERVRYIYDGQGRHALVEPHRLMVPLDGTAAVVLQQTRDVFSSTWSDHCEKSRPGWFRLR